MYKKYYTFFTIGISSSQIFADENPKFENNILTIPFVDSSDYPGKYRDVIFELTQQNTWQLKDYQYSLNNGQAVAIEQADLVVTNTLPVQAFLKVSGGYTDCEPPLVSQRLLGKNFEVSISSHYSLNGACPAVMTPFENTIVLPIYGLSAGTYTYEINSGSLLNEMAITSLTGSFDLTVENVIE